MNRPKLPDFTRPPVNEVALSVQFEALVELRAIHLGSLWVKLGGKKLFPSVEEQPSIPKSVERFRAASAIAMPQFELLNMPPLPRFLFISQSGNEVVQVQSDRFTFNWRKRSQDDVYPRYEAIELKFLHFIGLFISFLKEEKIGSLNVEQGEVTYVNQIPQIDLGPRIEGAISILSGDFAENELPQPEQLRLNLTFPMMKGESPFGRLHVEAVANTQSDAPALALVLVARGKPDGTDIKAATDFFRAGRVAIVNGFASITSKEMHKSWGRTDVS